jgi:hypothetical protein
MTVLEIYNGNFDFLLEKMPPLLFAYLPAVFYCSVANPNYFVHTYLSLTHPTVPPPLPLYLLDSDSYRIVSYR